jgi:signal transduction histidine kinase
VSAPVFAQVWSRRAEPIDGGDLPIEAAETLGHALVAAATPLGDAVRLMVAVGHTLIEVGERAGEIGPSEVRRLEYLVGEVAAQVAGSMERSQRMRRDAWLAFLAHELKNPLSTVLNALWLIREKGIDPARLARFVEMAERAVRRLEARTRDVRELEAHLGELPPGWEPRTSAIDHNA